MTAETTSNLYLEQILRDVHPMMAEGLYLAAIPKWYNVPLMAAIRHRNDGKDEGLVERLTRYSFIIAIPSENGEAIYTVRPDERIVLQRSWIAREPMAYRTAHQRALAYWEANPDPNPFAHAQNRLYHQLFVDLQAATNYLVNRFRAYHDDRQLAAIERLLETAENARFYLALLVTHTTSTETALPPLTQSNLDQLDELLVHLKARLAQLRGRWAESLELLKTLSQKPNLSVLLQPYVPRAIGYALANTGQYVEAMAQYREAITQFEKQIAADPTNTVLRAEHANTLISLGDAHIDLATEAQSVQAKTHLASKGWEQIKNLFYFFLSLPLVVYLSLFLGRRILNPGLGAVLRYLDWVVARLFAFGSWYYAQADPLLEKYGNPVEAITADEKLANLYFSLGDADKAREIFDNLLTQTAVPLGDYRKASLQVGMGAAYLRLGQPQKARQHLEVALPVLQLYEDAALLADAQAYLAEALVALDAQDEAIPHYAAALRTYQNQEDIVSATEVAERLTMLGLETPLPKYRYPVRYRHKSTRLFQQATLILLALVIFIIPITIIRLDTSTSVAPEITFNATPLLQSDNPNFKPDLSQGASASNLVPAPNPKVIGWLGFVIFISYLLLSTAIGILGIVRTSFQEVQTAAQSRAVRLEGQTIRAGNTELELPDVVRYILADTRVLDQTNVDTSSFALITPETYLVVEGNTAEYASLRQRIERLLPQSAIRSDLSYSYLRSRTGALFLTTGFLLIVLAVLGIVAPSVIPADIPGTPYSLADLYPYFYLGLFIPSMWWFAIRPLQIRATMKPNSSLPWWMGAIGAGLLILRFLTRFYPWLTVPDIYPSLTILMLVGGAAWAVWRARGVQTAESVHPTWVRMLALLVAAGVLLINAFHLWREVRAYHYLILGNAYRDQLVQLPDSSERDSLTDQAIAAYSRALQISDEKVLGLNGKAGITVPFGIPQPEQSIWFATINSRAALELQQKQYQSAIDDYTTLLEFSAAPDQIYASRAIAYLGLGTIPVAQGEVQADAGSYNVAATDFDRAIELNPDNANYYLWRAVANHALDNTAAALADYEQSLAITGPLALDAKGQGQAYTGQGWIYYAAGDYQRAIEFFQKSTEVNPDSTDGAVGLGYTYYTLRQYEDALTAWNTATELDPNDATNLISLGALYWRIGTLGDDPNASGSDRCSNTGLTEAQRSESAAQLQQALEQLNKATQIEGQEAEDVAFTYRTQAQVFYLLRNCPGYDKVEMLDSAVNSYSEAIELDEDNATYWHFRGRLAYALWLNLPAGSGAQARQWLFDGLADQEQALQLNPSNPDYEQWRATIYESAVPGTLARGDEAFKAGNYDTALAYYELVVQNRPEEITAVFKTGLATLATGNQEAALVLYQQAIMAATEAGNTQVIEEAWDELSAYAQGQRWADNNPFLQLFQNSGVDLGRTVSAEELFAAALTAVMQNNYQQAAELYNQGLELAAEAQDINAVKTAAAALRDYLLAQPEIQETDVYWPLWDDTVERETAVSQLTYPDLYWRYRAEFGFRLIIQLFSARPDRNQTYAILFGSIVWDIEQAFALAPETHRTWRDFFVDSNIGWLYLQRGNSYFQTQAYQQAFNDYVQATRHIQPNSENAINDLTDATFKAGLAALAWGNLDQAESWYKIGITLIEQYDDNDAALSTAITSLTSLLTANPDLAAIGGAILEDLDEAD